MKYQEYKQKMEKISKVLNVLYRFRFPIGGAIIAIIAGSLTLTGLSGKAQNVILESTELVYGQSVTAYGKSIFGDAEIEYSKVNEDNWSSEAPYRAGNYKARGKSKNGFGQITYTDAVDFSIAPKPLDVSLTATTITYGEELSYTSKVLKDRGDRIESINFTYGEEFDQADPFGTKDYFETKVKYDVGSVKIVDINNEDVTYCYDLNVSDLDLKVKKRQLKLVSSSTKKEYDGSPLTNENYYISNDTSLASGDEISFTPTSITEIGSVNINNNVTIMHGDKNRTKFYSVVWDAPGTLTIVKRKLTISTNDINRPYNGHILSDSTNNSDDRLEYTQTGLLTELGHQIKDVAFASQGAFRPIQASPNAINSYAIVDEHGNDVKDYYEVNIQEGTINITAVPLTITYERKERLYDFTDDPLEAGITYEGLLEDDKIEYTLTGQYSTTQYSESPLDYFTCSSYSMSNPNLGADVTDCYDVSFANEYGYVFIKKFPLTITTNSINTTYDGTLFSSTSDNPERKLSYEQTGLLEGHELSVSFNYESQMFVNADNTFSYNIIDTATSEDVTHLYMLTSDFGHITTNKRDVSVTFDSGEWVYDGAPHLADHYEVEGLADGDTIEFTSDFPAVSAYSSTPYVNSRSFYISRGGSPVDEFYNTPVIHSGTLTINRKELTISYTVPESKTYDAEPIPISPSDVTIEGLDTGTFTYDLSLNYGSIERWIDGGYDIRISNLEIYHKDDIYHENPLTDNFSFKYVFNAQETKVISANNLLLGHVDIYKRPLHISSKTLEKKYDGLPLYSDSDGVAYIYEESELLSAKGHFLELASRSEQTLVGSTTNNITVRVLDSSYNDVSDCYDMTGIYMTVGQLIVTENDSLVITFTNIVSSEYTGNNQVADPTNEATNLGVGDEIDVAYKPVWRAGEYSIDDCFNINILRDGKTRNVNNCYKDITIVGGPFVINKFSLDIYMNDITRGLDSGNLPSANNNRSISRAIPSTDTLNLQYPSNAVDLVEEGIYPTPSYTITNKAGTEDRLANYDIHLHDGIAHVELIDLNLSIVHQYPLSYTGNVIYPNVSYLWNRPTDILDYYNVELVGLECSIDGELKDPGTYTVTAINTGNIRVVRKYTQEDVTPYFNLNFGSLTGSIVISKAKIEIKELEFNKSYDGKEIFTGYEGSFFNNSHHIELVNPGAQSITRPGTITNVINDVSDVVVKDGQGNDVTYLYEIIIDSSVLGQTIRTTVTPCNIEIITPSYTKSFDGKPFDKDVINNSSMERYIYAYYDFNNSYYGDAALTYDNHVYDFDVDADYYIMLSTGDTVFCKCPVYTNYHVQTVSHEVDIQILDSDGNDISDCYNLTTNFGTLRINQLQYSYSPKANNKTYNGTSYTTIDSLTDTTKKFIDFNKDALPDTLLQYLSTHPDDFYAMLLAGETAFMAGSYTDTPVFVFMYNNEDIVGLGDILFIGGNVSSNVSKKNLTINNMPNQTACLDFDRFTCASEKLQISPWASGDQIYIGDEPFDKNKKNYIAIPDMSEIKVYTEADLALIINESIIHIYRTVNGVTYDVTSCYNITFEYYEITVMLA